jgi:hypothetical protein
VPVFDPVTIPMLSAAEGDTTHRLQHNTHTPQRASEHGFIGRPLHST